MEYVYKENELSDIAKKVLEEISTIEDFSTATLVTLTGDLGAGKTSLVQEIAKQIGIKDVVISPTYVIMKSYQTDKNFTQAFSGIFLSVTTLVHIDAYRLDDDKELANLGWDTIISNPENLIFIEWPEKVPELTKNPAISISLSHHTDDSRKMVLVRYTG